MREGVVLTLWFHSPYRLYQKASLNPKDTNISQMKEQEEHLNYQ